MKFFVALALFFSQCVFSADKIKPADVSLLVLGVAQDAGYPQINCYKPHCIPGWEDPTKRRMATSLAIIDRVTKQKFLFEATPDIKLQMYELNKAAADSEYALSGIILTHGHMGHYTGLMHFGREAAGTKNIPVFVMPRMKQFLESNGPWSQLVKLKNINIKPLQNNQLTQLNKNISIVPLKVPHRDEYTETVGYKIIGPNKSVLFIPDIDKWKQWKIDITELVKSVDYAFLDATFFSNAEIPNRDMSEVPHPFVEESMQLFKKLSEDQKKKIIFIHFNHSNPLLIEGSEAQQLVRQMGFRYATENMLLDL
jgi:pyrroloquinoline quinone biosynthesis protein B